MAGYIGKSQGVTQVDGYNRTEADDRYVNASGDTMTGALNGRSFITADDTNNYALVAGRYSAGYGGAVINTTSNASFLELQVNGFGGLRADSAGRVTMPYQPYIYGSPTNTFGTGIANSFHTISARGGMAFSSDRITVPVGGVYHISFNTICDNATGRVDTSIRINGGIIVNMLSEDNGTGYHYRSGSITILLAANDYIQFNNNDWYASANTGFVDWRTASVALLG